MNTQGSKRPHLVVLSGAGMSAESGLSTFRDSDGLWAGHDVQEVASIEEEGLWVGATYFA